MSNTAPEKPTVGTTASISESVDSIFSIILALLTLEMIVLATNPIKTSEEAPVN